MIISNTVPFYSRYYHFLGEKFGIHRGMTLRHNTSAEFEIELILINGKWYFDFKNFILAADEKFILEYVLTNSIQTEKEILNFFSSDISNLIQEYTGKSILFPKARAQFCIFGCIIITKINDILLHELGPCDEITDFYDSSHYNEAENRLTIRWFNFHQGKLFASIEAATIQYYVEKHFFKGISYLTCQQKVNYDCPIYENPLPCEPRTIREYLEQKDIEIEEN